MVTCTACGSDVTGKKFCPHCGSAVQAVAASATHICPACHAQMPLSSAFCTNCGSDMRAVSAAPAYCTRCGRQNAAEMKFCGGCGSPLTAAAQPVYPQPGQYPPMVPQQPQYQQPGYQQPQYPQYQQPGYQQQYGPGGYQPQPMMGQGPMVLRCPTCMAMSAIGTSNCPSCRTNLAGVVPVPSNMPGQSQQGGLGGFLQSGGGQLAVGALGGAAAVIGGEMLLHGIENSVENRVEENMGFGEQRHHRDEGLLGGLGDLSNDIGLF
jgi:hypothetical protein